LEKEGTPRDILKRITMGEKVMQERRNDRINVYDERGNVVAQVKYNNNLSEDKGLTKLKDKRYVLIYGPLNDKSRGIIISPEQALYEILKSGKIELLKSKKFAELKALFDMTKEYEKRTKKEMVIVFDNKEITGLVQKNDNLDTWDGQSWNCGKPGEHKGLAKLQDRIYGRYVLIRSTDSGIKYGEVIPPYRAVKEILKSGKFKLLEDFPELKETMKYMEDGLSRL